MISMVASDEQPVIVVGLCVVYQPFVMFSIVTDAIALNDPPLTSSDVVIYAAPKYVFISG